MQPIAFELIDTMNGDAVVGTYPTLRKAQNAGRKIEPEPTKPLGYVAFDGARHGWRYLTRPVRATAPAPAATPKPALSIKVGRKTYPIADYAEASRMTLAATHALMMTGARMSESFRSPLIFEGDRQVAYVSLNGRVWAGHPRDPFVAGRTPLCEAHYPEKVKP